jgi:ABC-type branched-subunit amino acid transport system ATPase component
MMEKGAIVHAGTSAELKSAPEVLHRYLGLSLQRTPAV